MTNSSDGPATALFIGGPEAGQVRMIRKSDRIIIVPEFDSAFHSYDAMPADAPVELVIRRRVYVGQRFSFFGAPMTAWVLEGLSERETAAQLGAAILNPLGLTLLREGAK